MLIKVNGLFLDFNDVIDVEQQARLFQDVSGVFGDYSYSFSIPITERNLSILDLKSINQRLTFARKKECILLTDSGEEIFGGFLRIESIGDAIECSFYSGNNSWFEATRKKLREYNFKRFRKEFSSANVIASWSQSNGIVWPLVDRGSLYKRRTNSLVNNDWQPFIYVKDVIKTVLSQSGGIKIAGDILKDPIYNSMITTNGGISLSESVIDEQLAYIGKASNQTISSTTFTTITFTDVNDPFSSSPHWNTSTSTYTVPERWLVGSFEYNFTMTPSAGFLASVIRILLNGVQVYLKVFVSENSSSVSDTVTINNASAGDTIVIQALRGSTFHAYDILAGSYIKIKPIKLGRVFPQQLLPDIDANEFISNIFSQLNVFSSYDHKTKTINTRFLENIKKDAEIDISPYVSSVVNNDFSELIGGYSKASRFLYGEASDDFTEQYNAQNPDLFYGGGFIVIDNDFLEDKSDFLELDFFAPFQIQIPWLGFRLPLLEMSEMVVNGSKEYTRVTNSASFARFSWEENATGIPNIFSVGGLVRITDQGGVDGYNGVFRVTQAGVVGKRPFIETDLILFESNSTGTVELITINDIVNEDQITICNVPSTPLADFTNSAIIYGETEITSIALGYFWLPKVNKKINRIKQSLTFGRINDPEYYQRSLLETYYPVTNQVLNDPVMITVDAYMPENVFLSIDFLRPVRLKMDKINALFLVNRKFGYNGPDMPCELELIKISNSELTDENTGIIVADAPPPDVPIPVVTFNPPQKGHYNNSVGDTTQITDVTITVQHGTVTGRLTSDITTGSGDGYSSINISGVGTFTTSPRATIGNPKSVDFVLSVGVYSAVLTTVVGADGTGTLMIASFTQV